MNQLLKDFPVVVEFPVAWGEMDAFQHVNNIVYFRYFESARIAYFDRMKLDKVMKKTNIGVILASTHCRFRIPLTHPDTVSIGTKVTELKEDRFTMKYSIVSHRFRKIAAEGEGVLVAFDYKENKKAILPEELKNNIQEIEKE